MSGSKRPAIDAKLLDTSRPILEERAVSMPFLLTTVGKQWPAGRKSKEASLRDMSVKNLQDAEVIPATATGRPLRDLQTKDVVKQFVKPATSNGVCSFVQAYHKKELPHAVAALLESTPVYLDHWRAGDIHAWRDLTGNPKFEYEYGVRKYNELLPATGPTTWFVSHAWNRPWVETVDAVWQHYLQQEHTACAPGHWQGEREIRILPQYFWVDIFAASQQILDAVSDISKHPDFQFDKVIAASQGTLFTFAPFQAPETVSRVWCLSEAMKTLQADRKLTTVPNREFWDPKRDFYEISTEVTLESIRRLMLFKVDTLDVNTASASVPADRETIMGQITEQIGVDQFNDKLRQAMRSNLMEALAMRSLTAKDHQRLKVCADNGAVLVRACIDLQHAEIGPQCGLQLGRILLNNQFVVSLALAGNDMGDEAVVELAGAIATMENLKGVDLGSNRIKEEGAMALAAAMRSGKCRAWEGICFDNNEIGHVAAIAIVEAAAQSQCLQSIFCKWNGLNGDTVAQMRFIWGEAGKDMKKLALEIQTKQELAQ